MTSTLTPHTTIPAPRNALTSFHYFRTFDMNKLAGLNVIGDSGAYSAKTQGATITNDDLGAWATKWRHRLSWVAAMDVMGDPLLTRRNWHALVDDHKVPAVPTIHCGTDPSEMDYYADRGVDFMGLGGMVGGSASVNLRWMVSAFRYARKHHPNMRFHGWGATSQKASRLPFYSVDSSSWGSGYRYGRLQLSDPRTGKDHAIRLDGRDVYRPEIALLLSRDYGVLPSDIATSNGGNRATQARVAALSASVREQRLQQLHRHSGITPPRWGLLNSTSDGLLPQQHLAVGEPKEVQVLYHLATTCLPNIEQVASMAREEHE